MAQATESWKVQWTNRASAPAGEKLCGGVVALVLVAQLGFLLAFIVLGAGHFNPALLECDPGYISSGWYCLPEWRIDEINDDSVSCPGIGDRYRQLRSTDESFPHMWEVLEHVWHVPLVMLVATVFLSVLWVFAMLKYAGKHVQR
mmetsp:Transcript_63782/g.146795  ORF Transcript_63782/g.146795 Transcript_63782/m.146795 type:complete len:145 (+) Transcript_63782:37-471(+)